jgi:L-lactate dehydrogenase complex protein LldG
MTSDNDLLEIFERYAGVAGAHVSTTASDAEAATAIAGIADGAVKCVAAIRDFHPEIFRLLAESGHPIIVAEEMAEKMTEAESGPSALAAALAGGTGLVLARAGVAETGSLVLADDALAPRLLSMLSDVCIVLLHSSTIVASLDEASALLTELQGAGHRYISMVTGPSRTADIERVLTIGVQGPKALHIVVMTNA